MQRSIGRSHEGTTVIQNGAQSALEVQHAGPLLEGEDPETTHAEDARHCIRLYTELISFKQELLSRAERALDGLSAEAKKELSATDVPVLEAQLARYEARLEFWYRRAWELEGIDLDREQLEVHYRGRSLELTRREYQLLACLMRHPYQYLSARRLVHLSWGEQLADEQLRVYVVRLRRKLQELELPARLVNRPRKGYSLIFD
jgi:DNA-binding response OmpR family regulator